MSTSMGCGYKTDCPGERPLVVVCEYSPAGNIEGAFKENVHLPSTILLSVDIALESSPSPSPSPSPELHASLHLPADDALAVLLTYQNEQREKVQERPRTSCPHERCIACLTRCLSRVPNPCAW